jgi:hypothetical protein
MPLLSVFIKTYETLSSQCELHVEIKLLEKISVDTDVKNQTIIRYSALVRCCRKYGSVMGHYLTFKKVTTEALYDIHTEFSIHAVWLAQLNSVQMKPKVNSLKASIFLVHFLFRTA